MVTIGHSSDHQCVHWPPCTCLLMSALLLLLLLLLRILSLHLQVHKRLPDVSPVRGAPAQRPLV